MSKIKKEIFENIQKLNFNIIQQLYNADKELIQKVLKSYLDKKPTKQHYKKIEKKFQEEGNNYELWYSNIHLGNVIYKSVEDKIKIKFEPKNAN